MNKNFNKKLCMIVVILLVFPICIVGCSRKGRMEQNMPETEDAYAINQKTDTENVELNNTIFHLEDSEITEKEELVDDFDFVNVKNYIPDICIELKYNTEDNFTGQKIYDFSEAYLRYGTVKKLLCVQNDLEELGLSLKIWDAFRPTKAQFDLWEVMIDNGFKPYFGEWWHFTDLEEYPVEDVFMPT